MFFLMRSAVCIGVVAVAAAGGGERLGGFAEQAARESAQTLGRACMASADCLKAGMDLVASATRTLPATAAERSGAATPLAVDVIRGLSAPSIEPHAARARTALSSAPRRT